MPVRKLVFALLGILSILALALLLWAPFLSLLPGGNLEFLGGAGRVRGARRQRGQGRQRRSG